MTVQENKSKIERIIRAEHDLLNPYVMILRATLQDRRLAFDSRGLLAYLLSKPVDWVVIVGDLCQECGTTKVYRMIKDLRKFGYLARIYHRDDKGRIATVEYVVYERPFLDYPQMDNPQMGEPFMGNQRLHNIDSDIKENPENKDSLSGDTGDGKKPKTGKAASKPRGDKPKFTEAQMTPMKNAIASAFNWQKPTNQEWGIIQKAAHSLLTEGITPEEIQSLYDYCESQFTQFKPNALPGNVSNWRNTLAEQAPTPEATPEPQTPIVKGVRPSAKDVLTYGKP